MQHAGVEQQSHRPDLHIPGGTDIASIIFRELKNEIKTKITVEWYCYSESEIPKRRREKASAQPASHGEPEAAKLFSSFKLEPP